MNATMTATPTTWVEVRPRRATDRRRRRHHALCPTTGKRRFRDRHDAGLELRRLGHQRSSLDAQNLEHGIRVVRAYRCEHCRGWHLTSKPLQTRGPQARAAHLPRRHRPRPLPHHHHGCRAPPGARRRLTSHHPPPRPASPRRTPPPCTSPRTPTSTSSPSSRPTRSRSCSSSSPPPPPTPASPDPSTPPWSSSTAPARWHGDRLDNAKEALIHVVGRLDDRDRFGLVVFDNSAQVVVPAGKVGDLGRDHIVRAIRTVQPGGMTDLSAGYFRGLQEARRVCTEAGATIILVSDGHANSGVTDPTALGKTAAQAATQGISTSSVGIGVGYDDAILDELATGGLGNHGYAHDGDGAAFAISQEIEGLLSKTVQAAHLVITPTADVHEVEVLNDLPVHTDGDAIVVELGDLYAGETRRLSLRFGVPGMGALGLAQIAELAIGFVSLPELKQHTVTIPVQVNVVPADVAAGPRARPQGGGGVAVRRGAEEQEAQCSGHPRRGPRRRAAAPEVRAGTWRPACPRRPPCRPSCSGSRRRRTSCTPTAPPTPPGG